MNDKRNTANITDKHHLRFRSLHTSLAYESLNCDWEIWQHSQGVPFYLHIHFVYSYTMLIELLLEAQCKFLISIFMLSTFKTRVRLIKTICMNVSRYL